MLFQKDVISTKKSFGIYIPIYTLCFLSLTIFPKRHRCAFWQVKRKETEKRYNTIYLLNTFSYLWEIFPFSCILHFSAKEGINDATKLDYFISSDILMKRILATRYMIKAIIQSWHFGFYIDSLALKIKFNTINHISIIISVRES